ncbi:MAG: hypothetical protein ACO3JL_08000, partial [Myxococcota bacterium]
MDHQNVTGRGGGSLLAAVVVASSILAWVPPVAAQTICMDPSCGNAGGGGGGGSTCPPGGNNNCFENVDCFQVSAGSYSFSATTTPAWGTAGEQLSSPLGVIVRDSNCDPSRKAMDVTFEVYEATAGWTGAMLGAGGNAVPSVTVKTDRNGFASAVAILGEKAGTERYWFRVSSSAVANSPIYYSAVALPGPVSALQLTGLVSPAALASEGKEGLPQSVTVRAVDQYGNLAAYQWGTTTSAYTEKITFSATRKSDGSSAGEAIVLPSEYQFTTADLSAHAFDVVFHQWGDWTLTVSDGALSATAEASIVEPTVNLKFAPDMQLESLDAGPADVAVGTDVSLSVTVLSGEALAQGATVNWSLKNLLTLEVTPLAVGVTTDGVSTVYVPFGTKADVDYEVTAALLTGETKTFSYRTIAGDTTQLVMTEVWPRTAGVSGSISLVAKDAYGNPTPAYTGVLRLVAENVVEEGGAQVSSSSADATLAQSTTYQVATSEDFFSIANAFVFTQSGVKRLIVSDEDNPLLQDDFTFLVDPAAAASLVVEPTLAGTTSVTAGTPVSLSVAAYDPFGNHATSYGGDVALASSDGVAVLPTTTALVEGSGQFEATFGTAGTNTISVDGSNLAGGTWSVVVTPGAPHAVLPAAGQDQAGEVGTALQTSLRVRVIDSFGNGIEGAMVNWSVAAGGGSLTTTETVTDSNGYTGTDATLGTDATSPQRFEAYVPALATSVEFAAEALPGAATHLLVTSGATQVTSGDTVTLSVAALDAYENVATGYTGTLTVSASEEGGTSTAHPVGSSDAGERIIEVPLSRAGLQTIFIDDGVLWPVTVEVLVTPGAAASLLAWSGDGQSGVVQTALEQPLVVMVTDAAGNAVPDVVVSWRAGTQGGSLPTQSVTGSDGTSAASPVLGTVASTDGYVFTATLAAGASVDFTASALHGPASSLEVTGLVSGAAVGTPLDVTVRVLDRFGNVATGYRNTLRFSSDDPQASLPEPVTLGDVDQGSLLLERAVRFGSVGSHTLTVTDAVDAGVVGVSAGVEVIARPTPSLLELVSGDDQSTTVATPYAEPLVVRALTAQGTPVGGVEIMFQGSEGTIDDVVVTGADGTAPATAIAGSRARGEQYVAVAAGLTPVSFAMRAIAGAAVNLVATTSSTSAESCQQEEFTLIPHDTHGNV